MTPARRLRNMLRNRTTSDIEDMMCELAEAVKPMEVIYIEDLDELMEDFAYIMNRYGNWYVTAFPDAARYEHYTSKALWEDIKGDLRYYSDRLNPERIAAMCNKMTILHDRLEGKCEPVEPVYNGAD